MAGTQASELEIRHEEHGTAGAFFIDDQGRRVAELTYTRQEPRTAVLQHTEVSTLLQGRGVARKLLDHAVAWARQTGTRIVPVCPYAKAVFDRTPELADVLR